MTLDRTKRYMAALLCAGGLSLLGNTVWADGGLFTWTNSDGTTVQISEQDARNRCQQCKNAKQQNTGDAAFLTNCSFNIQICMAVNITF